jgi:hypothetical protein
MLKYLSWHKLFGKFWKLKLKIIKLLVKIVKKRLVENVKNSKITINHKIALLRNKI